MSIPKKERRMEILLVALTGLLKFVFMDWLNFRFFYITAASLFWIFYVYRRHKRYPDMLQAWGFTKKHLKPATLFLLPFAVVVTAGIVWYGLHTQAAFINWRVLPILFLYPLWGLVQQFMMAGLIAGNLKALNDIKTKNFQIVLITALVFALVHYPSLPLMAYTFLMEVLFISVYFKWANLWVLGFYHGIISTFFIYFVLGRDLWVELWQLFG
ncbi:MAG: CPBP family glutamic-type intramembrane protease [Bacteroidota bacterium]